MRRTFWFVVCLLIGSGWLLARGLAPTGKGAHPPAAARPTAGKGELRLFETVTPKKGLAAAAGPAALRVIPGKPEEAEIYYNEMRTELVGFPQPTLQKSHIADMLLYYGFPVLLAKDLESLDPAVLMDLEKLRKAVSNPAPFEAAYRGRPLQADEIIAARFFAPKIVNVRDPKSPQGIPAGGFGWRKVVRFRAREGSAARGAGLDFFYLLFNFVTQEPAFPPPTAHAGQLQGLLVPDYNRPRKLRDVYFLVFKKLDDRDEPEQVGTYLEATFDLVRVVPDGRYYVPRSCGQCHGTVDGRQQGAKVNYLDTDHWIDRTGKDDDFPQVPAANVLVDGVPQAYAIFRKLNRTIEAQNAAVGAQGFALLATRKWLALHREGGPTADRHVEPLDRGFGDAPVWAAGTSPDRDLLPMLNRYCYRCHSSVAYHVFDRAAVKLRQGSIIGRVNSTNDKVRMPQDRELDDTTKARIVDLMRALK